MIKILDIKIIRDRKKQIIRLNQTHYLSEIFDELHMIADKHKNIQLFMSEYDVFRFAKFENKRINFHDYAHKIEKLIYAAIYTQSNIFFSIDRLN